MSAGAHLSGYPLRTVHQPLKVACELGRSKWLPTNVLNAADGSLFLASASQDKYARLWAMVPEGSTIAEEGDVRGAKSIVDGEGAAGSDTPANARPEQLGDFQVPGSSVDIGGNEHAVDITRYVPFSCLFFLSFFHLPTP